MSKLIIWFLLRVFYSLLFYIVSRSNVIYVSTIVRFISTLITPKYPKRGLLVFCVNVGFN